MTTERQSRESPSYKYLDSVPCPRDIDLEALKKQNRDMVLTLGVIVHAAPITHERLATEVDVLDLDALIGALLRHNRIFVAKDGYIPTKKGKGGLVGSLVATVEAKLKEVTND